jgi:hypothetical protein
MATSPFGLDFGVSKEAMRRKMAYAMMMQGSSGEPVKHWTQGLARALQGGMGGYELYREDQETKENEAAQLDALIKALGGGQPTQAPIQQPQAPAMPPQRVPVQSQAPQRSPVVAALSPSGTMSDAPQVMTPPAQKVAPSPRVWGTDEGEAAGLYPPSKPAMQAPLPQAPPLAFNDRFAALNPQANPQQAGQLQPVPVQTQSVAPPPPQLAQAQGSDINQQIIQMLQDKNPQVQKLGRGMAAAAVQKRLEGEKPTDEMREYDLYRRQGGKDSFFDFKSSIKRAGAIQNNVNVGGGSDKQIFDAMAEGAAAARTNATGLTGLREARAALQGGAITGAGAEQILGLQKVGALLGLPSDKIVNTETFRAAIAPQVAAILKSTVGTANISNTDREFAEKAVGGNITLDGKTIARLLDIMERASVGQLEGHRKRLEAVYPDAEKYSRERALFNVDMPAAIPTPAAAAPSIIKYDEQGNRIR